MSAKAIEVLDEYFNTTDFEPCSAGVLAALKAARIAVVELPEPQEREDDAEIATCWDVLPYQAIIWDKYPDEVQVSYNYEPSELLSPSEARDLAAALLAAADAAEAVTE